MPEPTMVDFHRTFNTVAESVLYLPETPPSELTPEAVSAIGDLIRACDALIKGLEELAGQSSEAQDLLTGVRAHRRLLYLAMAAASPDQAGFWTEEYLEQEQAIEAKVDAGQVPRFSSDQGFAAKLRRRWLGDDG